MILRRSLLLLSAICALMVLVTSASAAFTIPVNDGFVTDTAGILTDEQKAALADNLKAYSQETSNEIAVLIVPNLSGEDASDVSVKIGREWGVGKTGKDNGVLILVATEDRVVWISTGYGLEGALPDIVVHNIIEDEIMPAFRQGEYFEGLNDGIEVMKKHIAGEYSADRYDPGKFNFGSGFFLLFIILINFAASWLGRSKSFWMGGLVGAGIGVLLVLFSWSIFWVPGLAVIGLGFDFLVSRIMPQQRRGRRGGRWGGGGFGGGGFGGGSGGGGFGGFGGGSFGGGGAGGKW